MNKKTEDISKSIIDMLTNSELTEEEKFDVFIDVFSKSLKVEDIPSLVANSIGKIPKEDKKKTGEYLMPEDRIGIPIEYLYNLMSYEETEGEGS